MPSEWEPNEWTRRAFLAAAGGGLAAAALPRIARSAPPDRENEQGAFGFSAYRDLLQTLDSRDYQTRVLGYAPGRLPVVAIRAGGTKKPSILISAGSHSTEHAGVVAAVDLAGGIETEHEVHVLPCRDPVGLNGFRFALSLGLGNEPAIDSVADAERLMREEGEILYEEQGRLLVLIGEYGYANRSFYRRVAKGAPFLEPLKGRRLFFPSNDPDAPGAGPLERAYTQVVTPDGEVLHLNRFHDTRWAPIEVRCIRRLMADVQPRLTFDLHEYGGDDFWMSARRQRTEEDELWELRMAHQAARAVAATGASFPDEDYRPGSFFEKLAPGLFWLDPAQRGEGLNLVDYASRRYGPGFTVETGMRQDGDARRRMHQTVVRAAVQVFEDRYR